ncbi:MAG: redox-sensing transcriptional repressor Rex [Coriobacteriia bacterium]
MNDGVGASERARAADIGRFRGRVPASTVARLPLYLRCLVHAQALRMPIISSVQLAEMAGVTAAQVRKDLSYLGELGTRGTGYDVDSLISDITEALGLTSHRNVAVFGYGRLGSALRNYGGFMDRGFSVVAVFDSDPDKIGQTSGDLIVEDVADCGRILRERDVDIAVIATPAQAAQQVADAAVAAGVTSILNFAPVVVSVPDGVALRQVDLASELQILSFHLAQASEAAADGV